MTDYKEKSPESTQYDELKDSRQKSLVKQLQEFLNRSKLYAVSTFIQHCQTVATKDGVLDDID